MKLRHKIAAFLFGATLGLALTWGGAAHAGRTGATYSLPPGSTVSPGQTITSSWANTVLGDIAQALTNSLARDGSGGMSGALRVPNGSNDSPSLSFNSEPGTGFARPSNNDLRCIVAKSEKQKWTLTGTTITGTATVSGATTLQNTLSVAGDVSVATDKFKVLAASGNTTVGGTLGVTGATTLGGGLTVTGDVAATGRVTSHGVYTDGDITVWRAADTNTGALYLNAAGTRYLFYNGTRYEMPGAPLKIESPANGDEAARADWVATQIANAGADLMAWAAGGSRAAQGGVGSTSFTTYFANQKVVVRAYCTVPGAGSYTANAQVDGATVTSCSSSSSGSPGESFAVYTVATPGAHTLGVTGSANASAVVW